MRHSNLHRAAGLAVAGVLFLGATASSTGAQVCSCTGDLSGNGEVEGADIALVLGRWGTPDPFADLTGDGIVNGADLSIVLGNWGPCAAPANDNCADAPLIGTGTFSFCNALATTDGPAMPAGNCGPVATLFNNDLWYRFDAVEDGVLTVETCGASAIDTVLAVYVSLIDGQPACPTDGIFATALLGCNDDAVGCGLTSRLSINVWQGAKLKIRLGGFLPTSIGSGTLKVAFEAKGGSCTNAFDANDTGYPHVIVGNTSDNPIAELPGACFNGQPQGPAEWITYTAECWGFTVTTCHPDTDFDTVVNVLRYDGEGDCWSYLENCNDDSILPGCELNGAFRKSTVTIDCQPNDIFRIVVSGYNGASGNYRVRITTDCN